MDEKLIFKGLGVGAVVLALFAIFASGGSDEEEVMDRVESEIASVQGAVDALGDRIAAIQGAVAEVDEKVDAATADSAADIAAVAAETESLSAGLAAAQSEIAALGESLSVATASAAEPAPAAEAASQAAAENETASIADPGAPGLKPGQTAKFADGALSVFVSRLDDGSARLMIDGAFVNIAAGGAMMTPVGDDYCEVSLEEVSGAGAVLSALCGDELPAPVGLSVGETEVLKDGSIRVFASRVTDADARLSVNGALVMLAPGRSAPVALEDTQCRVKLDAIDRRHAQVSAACGDEVGVSALVSPGRTVTLGDGAARVFLAGLSDEGVVRFAVNGQSMASGGSGHNYALADGCAVTVEDVEAEGASFSYSC